MDKNDIRSLIGPKQNVAEEELVLIQDAVTRIKEIIASDVIQGIDKDRTTANIRKIINGLKNSLSDKDLANELTRGLATSVQR